MSVKLTGAQWKTFYADKNWWPESKFHDDEIIHLNGADSRVPIETPENVTDSDVVLVVYGSVMKRVGPLGATYCSDLPEYVQKWLNNQTHTDLVVQCPNDLVDQVMAAIEAAGASVKK